MCGTAQGLGKRCELEILAMRRRDPVLTPSAGSSYDPKKLGAALHGRLTVARECDSFDVYIFVAGNPANDYLPASSSGGSQKQAANTIRAIKTRCEELQRPLLQHLNKCRLQLNLLDSGAAVPPFGTTEAYWINNTVNAELSASALRRLLGRADVEHVELVHETGLGDGLNDVQDVFTSGPDRSGRNAKYLTETPPNNTTWSVQRVGAPLMWREGLTGEGIVVAILDSGVNYRHADLAEQMWNGASAFPLHGYNFEGDDNNPMDERGHGTCCAGIVAGNGTCGLATGVAPGATVMSVRIDNRETNCWRGMQFALENGAHVINQSLSWMHTKTPYYRGWRRACETILAAGVLHATSVGNKGDCEGPYAVPHNVGTPANCPPPWLNPAQSASGGISSAIACGATDQRDFLDDDSSSGPGAWDEGPYRDYPYTQEAPLGLIKPDVCAPGHTETCNWKYSPAHEAGAYTNFGKTSSATAHLAGSMALLAQACLRSAKPIIPARVQEALENTAVRIAGLQSNPARPQKQTKENGFGAGRIDAHAAYYYGKREGWWL